MHGQQNIKKCMHLVQIKSVHRALKELITDSQIKQWHIELAYRKQLPKTNFSKQIPQIS